MPPIGRARDAIYRVHFKNRLAYGRQVFTPCQRTIEIRSAKNRERAIEAAKKRFARLERISDWHIHASIIEVEMAEPPAANRQSGAAPP